MNSSRDRILNAVKENKPQGDYPYPGIPLFSQSSKPLLDEFKENLVLGAGTWHEIAGADEAAALIPQLHPDAKVICSVTPEITGNRDINLVANPHELNDVDVGVIRAEFGVAETGMVWVTEEDLVVNSLAVLSQHLVILLDPAKIVRDMHEAYRKVDLQNHHYGSFLLGPSATADIGAYMVHGAQGARTLAVLLIP